MTERFAEIRMEAAWGKAVWVLLVLGGLVLLFAVAGCESSQPASPPTPTAPIEQSAPSETPTEPGAAQEPEQEPETEPEPQATAPVTPAAPATLPKGYTASRIEILPLSELVASPDSAGGTQLNAYVSLFDAFGSRVKAPGTFRFELYDYVQRSAEPKGQRIAVWPDIDLTDPSENNRYWQDFLRAYVFELASQAPRSGVYILEATCICTDGRRLSADFMLRPEQ